LLLLGNYEAQHHHGVPMQRLLPIVLRPKPQGLLFEAANPRHAHEWWGTDCGFGTFASFGPVDRRGRETHLDSGVARTRFQDNEHTPMDFGYCDIRR